MKRKILISVLAVALVLTLCICMFVACDPKPEEQSKPAPKVTVYGTDGNTLGTEQSVDMGDGTYSMTDPAQEYTLKAAQYTYFTYQLYDPATKETKGAFDYRSFKAGSDFSVIVVAEGIGEKAEEIEEKWRGQFLWENKSGEVSEVEVKSVGISLTLVNGVDTIEATGSMLKDTVWTKDGSFIIEYEYSLAPEAETAEEEPSEEDPAEEKFYTYYAFALSADGKTLTMTNLSDMADGPYTFTKKPDITVTVHYTLGGEVKTAEMEANSEKGKKYSLNNPTEYIDDFYYNWEPLKAGEIYNLYYYDEAAADHKGAAFDNSEFEAPGDFEIIIVKETFADHATTIDQSWAGAYTGEIMFGQPYALDITGGNNGTIILNDGYDNMTGTVGEDGTILNADGKLVLGVEYFGAYNYYYFTKNADGTITMENENGNVTFTKCDYITVTINYTVGGTAKTATAKAFKTDDGYELFSEPINYLNDTDMEALGSLELGQELNYFYYKNNQKGEEFDWTDFSDTTDFSILIDVNTFATAATKIDEKYNGTFTATDVINGAFTLTINATAGTIHFEYDDAGLFGPEPVDASITKGTVLNTTDGKLMFTSGTDPEYSYWFYLSEKDGTYTLESSLFYGETYQLTRTGGGTQPSADPYAGTTWTGKASDANKLSVEFEFSADGTVTITIGSYTPLKGKYTYANGEIKVTDVEDTDAMASVEVTITNLSDTSMKVKVSYEDQDSYDTLIKEAELTKAAA